MLLSQVVAHKLKASRVSRLPKGAQQIINSYKHLRLGNKKVSAPYHINRPDPVPRKPEEKYKARHSFNRAHLAKGNPKEIEDLVKKLVLKYHFDLNSASVEEIQEFMFEQGVGIDCSGFVVWALNEMSILKSRKPFWQYLKPSGSFFRKTLFHLRPLENISVTTLKNNASLVADLKNVKAADVIITHPHPEYNHIILITEVGFNKKNDPLYIDYCQATAWYDYRKGIIEGTIIVTDPDKYLAQQKWFEDKVERNYTFAGVLNDIPAAKIMRFEFLF